MNTTYYKYEILRVFRNRQNFLFSMILPVDPLPLHRRRESAGRSTARCPCRPTSWPA